MCLFYQDIRKEMKEVETGASWSAATIEDHTKFITDLQAYTHQSFALVWFMDRPYTGCVYFSFVLSGKLAVSTELLDRLKSKSTKSARAAATRRVYLRLRWRPFDPMWTNPRKTTNGILYLSNPTVATCGMMNDDDFIFTCIDFTYFDVGLDGNKRCLIATEYQPRHGDC